MKPQPYVTESLAAEERRQRVEGELLALVKHWRCLVGLGIVRHTDAGYEEADAEYETRAVVLLAAMAKSGNARATAYARQMATTGKGL